MGLVNNILGAYFATGEISASEAEADSLPQCLSALGLHTVALRGQEVRETKGAQQYPSHHQLVLVP